MSCFEKIKNNKYYELDGEEITTDDIKELVNYYEEILVLKDLYARSLTKKKSYFFRN